MLEDTLRTLTGREPILVEPVKRATERWISLDAFQRRIEAQAPGLLATVQWFAAHRESDPQPLAMQRAGMRAWLMRFTTLGASGINLEDADTKAGLVNLIPLGLPPAAVDVILA